MQLDAVDRDDTLADKVYDQLKRSLLTGKLAPGERMTIRALASAVSVSLTPAREAMSRLVAEGALEFGPNRTVYVPVLTPERIEEVYAARIALEGLVAEAAASRLTKADLERLERIQSGIGDAFESQDYKKVLSENHDFHFTIYRASGMPVVVKFIESLWLLIGPSLNLLYPTFEKTREGVQNHLNAIEAARHGDG